MKISKSEAIEQLCLLADKNGNANIVEVIKIVGQIDNTVSCDDCKHYNGNEASRDFNCKYCCWFYDSEFEEI